MSYFNTGAMLLNVFNLSISFFSEHKSVIWHNNKVMHVFTCIKRIYAHLGYFNKLFFAWLFDENYLTFCIRVFKCMKSGM